MRKNIVENCDGVVMVEFTIVFLPIFTFFLCIVQMGFVYTSTLGTQHAANRSARAATVIFPDDPQFYEDKAVNQLSDDGCEKNESNHLSKIMSFLKNDDNLEQSDCRGGPRVSAVRSAAILSMLPFGSRIDSLVSDEKVGSSSMSWLAMAYAYGLAATAISFPVSPMGDSFHLPGHSFASDGNITVRVTHLFHCQIPVAKHIICDSFGERFLRRFSNNEDNPTKEDLAMAELKQGVAMPKLFEAIILSKEHFFFIRKEATLPIQGADYVY